MDKAVKIALILTAMDKASAVVDAFASKSSRRLRAVQDKSYEIGKKSAVAAAALGGAMMAPISAFADLEDAGLRLKSVMMRDGGVVPEKMFKALNEQAIMLGNKLPGTTADFQNLYATMLEQGTPAQAILSGTGKAAAYLAVQLKMPTDQAGILASRLRMQMGIADNEMMKFMDIMARIKNVGVDPVEMQYAFGRSAGVLKLLNVQGLQASKTMGALFALLIREGGATGETAGTGISKILNELMNPTKMKKFNAVAKEMGLHFEFFKNGKFLGMENFVAQLSKFGGMDPQKIAKLLIPLTGGEGMDNQFIASLSKIGPDGLNKMTESLASQAAMTDKVNLMLDGLKLKWEAGLGNFINALAAFGGAISPLLKGLADGLGSVSASLQKFITQHQTLSKVIGVVLIAFTGLLSIVAGGGFLIGAFTSGLSNMILLFSNPLIRWIPGIFAQIGAAIARMGLLLLTRGIPAMVSFTATVWANAAAWLANPATWIILGIIAAVVALVAIGYVLYKNWDKIMLWFSEKWVTLKAGVSGVISVFKLFGDVLLGIGKIVAGIFLFDTSMIISGASQTSAAFSKIIHGGISEAFNKGFNESIRKSLNVNITGNGSKTNGPVQTIKSLDSIRPTTKSQVNNHFSPTINLSGGTAKDGKVISDNLKSQWEKWHKEKERNDKMTKYN